VVVSACSGEAGEAGSVGGDVGAGEAVGSTGSGDSGGVAVVGDAMQALHLYKLFFAIVRWNIVICLLRYRSLNNVWCSDQV